MQIQYTTTHHSTALAIRHSSHAESIAIVGPPGSGRHTLRQNIYDLHLKKKIIIECFEEKHGLSKKWDKIISLPSLREQTEDIGMICHQELGSRIDEKTIQDLKAWNWAGEREELVTLLRAAANITHMQRIPSLVFQECRELRPLILKVLPLTNSIYQLSKEYGLSETLNAIQRVTQVRAIAHAGGRLNRAAEDLRLPYHRFYYELKKTPDIWKRLSQEWGALQGRVL
ncbi:MAG: hypothetical protein AB8C84_03630 [Oligoflexales bacterium]